MPTARDATPAVTPPPQGYKYVFNACRVPKPNADEIRLYDPTQYNAVCVLRHNHFYLLPVYPPDGERLSTLELAMGLQKVVDMAGDTAGPAVGVLTADPREKWAEVRARLIAEGNSAALEQIESAILVVCLDDHVPGDGTAVGRLLLHGALSGANNRFFDKTFELVVFADGQAGLNAEHSMFDGGVTLAVVTYVLQGLCDGTVDHGPATARGVLPEPHPIVFKLGESVLQVKWPGPDAVRGGGGLRSAISRNFPQLFFACPRGVLVGALWVPCAEVLLLEASGGLVMAPQFSRNFHAISAIVCNWI